MGHGAVLGTAGTALFPLLPHLPPPARLPSGADAALLGAEKRSVFVPVAVCLVCAPNQLSPRKEKNRNFSLSFCCPLLATGNFSGLGLPWGGLWGTDHSGWLVSFKKKGMTAVWVQVWDPQSSLGESDRGKSNRLLEKLVTYKWRLGQGIKMVPSLRFPLCRVRSWNRNQ